MPRGGKRIGAGRKSAYKEKADADFLARMFFTKHKKEDIKKMLDQGNYSISDAMLVKALGGDGKVQIAIFNKLFPDKPEGEQTRPIINLILYNERDKHTLQVRSEQKAISAQSSSLPGKI